MSLSAKPKERIPQPKLVPRPNATSKARANKVLPGKASDSASQKPYPGSPVARRTSFSNSLPSSETKPRPRSAPKRPVNKNNDKMETAEVLILEESMDATRPSSTDGHDREIYTRDASESEVVLELSPKDILNKNYKVFQQMKRDLDLKQQDLLDFYTSLKELAKEAGEQMAGEGLSGDGGEGLPELVMFNVADWSIDELAQLCRSAGTETAAIEFSTFDLRKDESMLTEINFKLCDVPTSIANVCQQALSNRQDLLDYAEMIIGMNAELTDEVKAKLNNFSNEGQNLSDMLDDIKIKADNDIEMVLELSRGACSERSALTSVGEALVREVARLKARIGDLERQPIVAATPMHAEFEEISQELQEERSKRASLSDRLSSTEAQLRTARGRLTKMEKQLKEADASLAGLTATIKTMEDQKRQREIQFETKARKLREAMKTGELNISQITQERETLEAKIKELTEQITTSTEQHNSAELELRNDIRALESRLEEQVKACEAEAELKNLTEKAVAAANNTIKDLKAKIDEMERKMPNPDAPTQQEMELWAELQTTKDALQVAEDEVTACRREKIRFLETMTKIAEHDKGTMQQKLAAELATKEELIGKMQSQLRELTRNYKLNEQKMYQYEQHLKELQTYNESLKDNNDEVVCIRQHELQQEIMNLRMGLVEVAHHNEELTEELVQKQMVLETQEKQAGAQLKAIKMREELIEALENKETEQSRELQNLHTDLQHRMKIVDEVNKQVAAKAEEIQDLFTSLEGKQQQILRLEKIVKALEEQQRRAQAQRTRHEEKIAALEHELESCGARRRSQEKKFLFF